MKNQILSFILRPLVIALPLAVVILWFLPPIFSTHQLSIEKTNYYKTTDKLFRKDLNGDGMAEIILLQKNSEGKANFLVHHPNDLVQGQYNLNGYFHNGHPKLGFADLDGDALLEVYLTTHRNDSLFLNICEPFDAYLRQKVFFWILSPFLKAILIWRNEMK